jgi:hypothetical protein
MLFWDQWPRPDKAHLSPCDIPKLWQFVKIEAPQISTYACSSRVAANFEERPRGHAGERTGVCGAMRIKRPKLDERERPAAMAYSLVPEQHRRAAVYEYGGCDQDECGPQHRCEKDQEKYVKKSLPP